MPRDFEFEEGVPHHVAEQLMRDGWSALEAREHAGYLLFPSEIYRRKKDGTFEKQPVMLRLPRQHELRAARREARAIAARDGMDQTLDADMIADLEVVCTLAKAIRNTTDPFEPFIPDPELLEKMYDKASLVQAWAKLDALNQVVDPAPHSMTEGEFLVLVAKLAKERNLDPLAVYARDAQASFVTTMAERLFILLGQSLLPELSGPSTPESSAPSSSPPS